MKGRKWIYKSFGMFLCGVIVVVLAVTEKKHSNCKEVPLLSKAVQEYINAQKITKYKLENVKLPNIHTKEVEITVLDVEIEKYIKDELASYDYLKKLDKRIIEEGDFLQLEYGTEADLKDAQQTVLKVGNNLFDKKIEKELIGKKTGKVYCLNSSEGMHVYIRVLSIVKYVEQKLTKSFIKKQGYHSEADYRENVRKQMIQENERQAESEEYNKLIQQMIQNSNIILDEKEVAAYALANYVTNDQQVALLNGQDFETYLKENYKMGNKEYYQSVYEQSEEDIKKILAEGILAVAVGAQDKEYADEIQMIKDYYLNIHYNLRKD